MDHDPSSDSSRGQASEASLASPPDRVNRKKTRSSHRTPALYQLCDLGSEGLIYFILVFGAWAFGATQPWSIWTLNIANYLLGLLWLCKGIVRWTSGYRPRRWNNPDARSTPATGAPNLPSELLPVDRPRRWNWDRFLTLALGILTLLVLGYCLVSAVNARATFLAQTLRFEYYDSVPWLPHSYDRPRTWFVFWQFLGLALFFWATRDWLLGKTRADRQEEGAYDYRRKESSLRVPGSEASEHSAARLPARLNRLLWVLSIHGACLATEGLVQRWSGTNQLLWLVTPRFNQTAVSQFGPYAYRSNAAEYLNLIWPVAAGFCWTLVRQSQQRLARGQRSRRRYLLLLPMIAIMAASPVAATTRGGMIIAALSTVALGAVMLLAISGARWRHQLGLCLLLLIPIELALFLGWPQLRPRFDHTFADGLGGRTEIFENARRMAEDFPVFGSGPGTFAWLSYFYRADRSQSWAGYVHNDWLETRITFGWLGFSLVALLLVPLAVHWFAGRGIPADGVFLSTFWISLGGCLIHAAFDFPLQIYSIVTLFLLLGCVAFCVARPPPLSAA
jgi:hypothetical protein